MAPSDEIKMAELKRLLRRLDGLDSRRSAGAGTNEDAEQRDYVGTLRGALEPEDGIAPTAEKPQQTVSPRSAALLAGVIAALISTATVYVLMSAEQRAMLPSSVKSFGMTPPGPASPMNDRGNTSMELVRNVRLSWAPVRQPLNSPALTIPAPWQSRRHHQLPAKTTRRWPACGTTAPVNWGWPMQRSRHSPAAAEQRKKTYA